MIKAALEAAAFECAAIPMEGIYEGLFHCNEKSSYRLCLCLKGPTNGLFDPQAEIFSERCVENKIRKHGIDYYECRYDQSSGKWLDLEGTIASFVERRKELEEERRKELEEERRLRGIKPIVAAQI